MKKYIIVLTMVFVFSGTMVAEDSKKHTESDVYYVSAKIVKIFSHHKGYRVIYRTTGFKVAEVNVPFAWSKPADGRAVFTKIPGNVDPYITFFMRNGEFDFVKLSLSKNLKHYTWGVMKEPHKFDASFDVDTVSPAF